MATELVQTEIKVATLEADNKALKSDIENLNLKNNIAELEIQKLKSQVEDLETANAELTSSINNLEGTFDPLVESIEIIEGDMENLMIWQNGTEEIITELQVHTQGMLVTAPGYSCMSVTDFTILVIHDLFVCTNICRIIFRKVSKLLMISMIESSKTRLILRSYILLILQKLKKNWRI